MSSVIIPTKYLQEYLEESRKMLKETQNERWLGQADAASYFKVIGKKIPNKTDLESMAWDSLNKLPAETFDESSSELYVRGFIDALNLIYN
jgi:hypothetical protein